MNPIENQQLCSQCEQAIRHGGFDLEWIPKAIKKIIETGAWQIRKVETGETVELDSFRELIVGKFPRGWDADPARIEAIIRDDAEVLAMWREAMKQQGKRNDLNNNFGDNVTEVTKGNSRSYMVSRLKRQRQDLFELVKAGELSANAAAIKAGWRKKKTPLQQLHFWWQKCTQNEKREFLNQCTADLPSSSTPS